MIETKELTIGAHEYRLTHVDAKKARGLQVILAHLIGPALEAASGETAELKKIQKAGKEGATEAAGGLALKAFSAAFASLNDGDYERLTDAFAAVTSVKISLQGREPEWVRLQDWYGTHFANNYGEQTSWLFESVRYNFSSLFQGAAFQNLMAVFARKSPSTSTG